jgi:hypothetical protein
MSLFDLIEGAMGRPDPTVQMMAKFGQAPGQPGSAAGPQPLAPPPSGAAPGAAPPGAAPGGGPAPQPPPGAGPPGGAGGPPGGPQQQQQQQAPPQPQAYTSPPDLMQMYAAVAQRTQANEQFNRGLAGITAAFSPLSQRNSIMHEWDNMTQDPGSLFSNIMALQNNQYQQQQRQQLAAAAPALAKQLFGDQSPDSMAKANAIIASGKYGDVETSLAGVSGDPGIQQMRTDLRSWTAAHTDPTTGRLTAPVPDYYTNYEKYKAQMQFESTTAQGVAKDQLSAKQDFAQQNQSFNQAEGLLGNLLKKDSPLDEVTQNLLPATGPAGVIKSAVGLQSPEGGQAAADLQQLKSILYSKAFQSTGSRRTQQEVSRLSDALSQLDNTNLTPQQLRDQLTNIQEMTRQAHANIYGAAGQVAPDDYYNLVDPIYKPKGDLYSGVAGGGKGGFVGAPAPAAASPAATTSSSSGGVKTYNPKTGMIE